jgi:hypothetical protein
VRDPDENYLLLEAAIAGRSCIIGSIYGPNNTDLQFFRNLERDIAFFGNENIVLEGDWNCTVSSANVATNPDCLNMASIPNRTHSLKINDLCDQFNLFDPFRTLNPNLKEYTYIIHELIFDMGLRFKSDRDILLRRAELCKDDIDLPRLENLPLDPDPDIFFETLIGMIKNEIIS